MPPHLPDAKRAIEPRAREAEISSEDFLFHLYRGSELLQDNRVHEAKEELEAALNLQPLDPKGQDLLAVVYFRLGMYPRAIEIFEQLVRAYPDERTPRVNLALCYLKTGQPQNARQLLEATVEVHPDNGRAWGYLGLAYERLGDYVKARAAFARGGHDGMARRMETLTGERWETEPSDVPSSRPVSEPFEELEGEVGGLADRGDRAPDSAAPLSRSGSHHSALRSAHPGALTVPPPPRVPSVGVPGSVRPLPPPSVIPPPPVSLGAFRAPSALPPRPALETGDEASRLDEAPSAAAFARQVLVVFPRGGVTRHPTGLVRINVTGAFACRVAFVRAMLGSQSGAMTSEPLARRARGKNQEEPLGGADSPILKLAGAAQLLLGPHPGRALYSFCLSDEIVFLREDALVGFDETISYENGRLAVGDGDAAAMVQLRGPGAIIMEGHAQLYALEVTAGAGVSVRREHVIGWIGRVLARPLSPSEAPAGQRGLVFFSGEGMILADPR